MILYAIGIYFYFDSEQFKPACEVASGKFLVFTQHQEFSFISKADLNSFKNEWWFIQKCSKWKATQPGQSERNELDCRKMNVCSFAFSENINFNRISYENRTN